MAKRTSVVLLMALAVLIGIAFMPIQTNAATETYTMPKLSKHITITKSRIGYSYKFPKKYENWKFVSAECDKAELSSMKDYKQVDMVGKKIGKAKAFVNFKKGKVKAKYYFEITVKKYANPTSSFIINGVDLTSKVAGSRGLMHVKNIKNKEEVPFIVIAKKGWKFNYTYEAYTGKENVKMMKANEMYTIKLTNLKGHYCERILVDTSNDN